MGGLDRRPILAPFGRQFPPGHAGRLPLALDALPGKPAGADLEAALQQHYAGATHVRVIPPEPGGKLEPQALNNTNDLEIRVYANAAHRQAVVVAKLDNLGKGASGAAVQNMELMLACPKASAERSARRPMPAPPATGRGSALHVRWHRAARSPRMPSSPPPRP